MTCRSRAAFVLSQPKKGPEPQHGSSLALENEGAALV